MEFAEYLHARKVSSKKAELWIKSKAPARLPAWREAAKHGSATAMVLLAHCLDGGIGLPKDEVEATKWDRKAAELGHASGQNGLGVMYEHGRGVAQDHVEAVKWY